MYSFDIVLQAWDDNGGKVDFNSNELNKPYLAGIIENQHLIHAAKKQAEQFKNFHSFYGHKISNIKLPSEDSALDSVSVCLDNGDQLDTSLLVYPLFALLFRIDRRRWSKFYCKRVL
jgi:2-polyprenyl-6-methoxyphenol hydroxylase-like FAD-dependent oxidoreductase